MDLSKLPLMPSAELPEVIPAPPEPFKPADGLGWSNEGVVLGCNCPACRSAQDSMLSGIHPTLTAAVQRRDGVDFTAISTHEVAAAFADVTSTGRKRAASPQIQNWPRNAPPVQESRRIRGRYSTYSAYTSLHGVVRWREPGTLDVWDDSTGGELQWTFSQEDADGSLRGNSMRWYPTEV